MQRTEWKSADLGGPGTSSAAPKGTEEHRDHVRDHDGDHEVARPLGVVAEALLVAISEGSDESLALAETLAREILEDPLTVRALALTELLRARSPFALVRAVELAEIALGAATSRDAITRTKREKGGTEP